MSTQNELKMFLNKKMGNKHFSEDDMMEFNDMLETQYYPSKIVGSTFLNGAQEIISLLHPGDEIVLKDETDNKYDNNAIACYYMNRKIGYIPKTQAPYFKDFYSRKAKVFKVIGELREGFSVGCVIRVKITKIGEVIMENYGGVKNGTY